MKNIILVILVIGLGLGVVFAQGDHKGHKHHKHHPKLNKEARAALQIFNKEEVYPVKKTAHNQFLAALSAEDRTFLDQKRAEEKALHQEMKSVHQEMKGLRDSDKTREEMHEMRKEKFAPLREKRSAFMESMKPFMEKNEALVKTSMQPMKENHEAWKTKKRAILEQYLSTEEKAKKEACKKERTQGDGHKGRHHGEKGNKKHKGKRGKGDHAHEGKRGKGAVQFVLWDGEMRTPKEGQTNEVKSSNTTIGNLTETNAFTVSSYPNPAISQTTILLNLTQESNKVKISLTNTEGQQVWTKNYNRLASGEHQVDVDLHKLVSGNYFYTVEIGAQRITKPFVVNK
jgi:hypothetical protein